MKIKTLIISFFNRIFRNRRKTAEDVQYLRKLMKVASHNIERVL